MQTQSPKGFSGALAPLLLLAVGLLALAIAPDVAASPAKPDGPEAPQIGPLLSIQSNIPATANSIVTVPVHFTANGNSISSLIFSIDYDQTWLWFDPSVPMSVTMSLPAGFVGGCSPNTSDPFAEINCYVLYPIPPLQPLTDGVIASIKLRTKAPAVNLAANVGFSGTNPASFGSTSGTSVAGSTQDGSVYIDVGCVGCQPKLWIASGIPSTPNSIVSVPVHFSPNNSSISDLTFSIDYDQTWLWFDQTVPSAITPSLPAGFQRKLHTQHGEHLRGTRLHRGLRRHAQAGVARQRDFHDQAAHQITWKYHFGDSRLLHDKAAGIFQYQRDTSARNCAERFCAHYGRPFGDGENLPAHCDEHAAR